LGRIVIGRAGWREAGEEGAKVAYQTPEIGVSSSSIASTGAAADAGVRRFLLKPVNFSVLMPLVQEAVGSG
jgi:hypothetical protein